MRILTSLTYYHPHYSGLTIYAERLARALVERGHQVTVLTSRYDRSLPATQVLGGVQVIRSHVLMRMSKAVIMPTMFYLAWINIKHTDIVHLHLPQLDAAYIALISRLLNKPVVLTYQCDLRLPAGLINSIANQVSYLANHIAFRLAHVVVTISLDYAEASPFMRHYLSKTRAILPPVELMPPTQADMQSFLNKANLEPGQRIIGMAARLATEKGVEYLVEAMHEILIQHPTARVLYMGQYQKVMGEEEYYRRLAPKIQELGEHWTFLGNLPPAELTAFFQRCEVTVLPSINSTEAFGIVQLESMSCGTPVVASNLPGVRQPVYLTGMGRVVPPADPHALAQAITEVLDHPERYRGDINGVINRFAPQRIAEEYEQVFEGVIKNHSVTGHSARN
jgi:glycosyltransferase involved in cell wall biosynthesis